MEVPWSNRINVEISSFEQTVRSWLTMAGDAADYRSAPSQGAGMRWALQLALVSAFSLHDFTAVTFNTIISDDEARRRLQDFPANHSYWNSAAHINYTVISIDDISTVVQAPNFEEFLTDSLELAAFHYDVDLPAGVLKGVGSNSEVETKIGYSMVIPLDLAQHSSAALERGLRAVLNDPAQVSLAMGNATILRSTITQTVTVDLSPPPNATYVAPPPIEPEPVAAVVMTLMIVASGVGAFFFLLYRVVLPVYQNRRVAPASKYEWEDPIEKAKREAAEKEAGGKEQDMRSISFGPVKAKGKDKTTKLALSLKGKSKKGKGIVEEYVEES